MKNIKLIIAILIFSIMIPSYSHALPPITISLNGSIVPTDVAPSIENGRTLVPIAHIFGALGADVKWDGDRRTVLGTLGDTKIELAIDNQIALVNSRMVRLDVPARIQNSRTIVPLRFVAESLGATVEWDDPNRHISITTRISEPQVPQIPQKPQDELALSVYFMRITPTSFVLDKEIQKFDGPELNLMELGERLLKQPNSSELTKIIPEGTTINNMYIQNKTAFIDFSAEIKSAQYGHEAESVLVNSIVKTFTQLDNVDYVQILVDGEITDTLSGHIPVDAPLQ
ncbi:hypothetical protein J2Z35_000576 [Acetoanaerobium pronyense]|uniref:GerMN domain-containing protein n=1 Tax=Acetoanaerobium pronyense TaxID=1482736 RepID=A0ABS4KG74_9FIRM|nr:stalk domain-containing protein [Acetoanaerobium pronyense]MBP2026785.1 hypothetical protein [Acetoanaerobium pronyense]